MADDAAHLGTVKGPPSLSQPPQPAGQQQAAPEDEAQPMTAEEPAQTGRRPGGGRGQIWSGSQLGSSDEYESEDEEALGLNTAPAEFYDPVADDRDEKWAAEQRQGRKSDALLSCPGCLTTVCIDCQQHAEFEGQFRAMFTINCRVDTLTAVRPAAQQHRSSKRRGKRRGGGEGPAAGAEEPQELYHPVLCDVCDTEMGVQCPEDEIFTFFNVVPSLA